MRSINELAKMNIKPIHLFLEEKVNDESLNEGIRDWAKAGLEWVTKTYQYLKDTIIAKCGKYFVGIWDDGVMPAVLPITGQQAYLNGAVNKKCITFLSNDPNDKKYVKLNTSEKDVVAKRPGYLEGIYQEMRRVNESKENEFDWSLINEEYLDPEFVKNGYQYINEDDKQKKQENVFNSKNKEFTNINADDKKLKVLLNMAWNDDDMTLVIWGAPGIGKTQVVKKFLKTVLNDYKSRFIDFMLSTADETSFFLPDYEYDDKGNKIGVRQLPLTTLPVYKPTGDPKKDKKQDESLGRGMLFFDEMNRARESVLNICLKLINERMLGDWRLGSGWTIVAACNRREDDPDTDLHWTRPLGNRFHHVNYAPKFDDWKKWAESTGIFDVSVLDFIDANKERMYNIPDDENWEALFASPRSWEAVCQRYHTAVRCGALEGVDMMDSWKRDQEMFKFILSGAVGSTAVDAFCEYLAIQDTIDLKKLKLVWTDSDKAPLPEKEGRRYKLDSSYVFTLYVVKSMDSEPTAKEFEQLTNWLIRLDDSSLMHRIINFLFEKYPSMHSKIGDAVQGKSKTKDSHKYADSMMKLSEHYKRYANKDFEAMMNGLENQ